MKIHHVYVESQLQNFLLVYIPQWGEVSHKYSRGVENELCYINILVLLEAKLLYNSVLSFPDSLTH